MKNNMRRVLLINPGHDNEHEIYKHVSFRKVHRDSPPVALLYVATYLSEHGYEVDIVDTHIEENYTKFITDKIAHNDYLFAGITVVIGKFLRNAKELTSLIRKIDPHLPVVWGGIVPSILTDDCLTTYKPNYIVRFEGEETCLELADALKNGTSVENINGISYLKGSKAVHNQARLPKLDLDEYPIPKWELLGKYFNKEQLPYYYSIMSSKGCPFNCKFCYKHSIDIEVRDRIPEWRYRSSRHIIEEIDYIHRRTGTRVFTFGDDNFLANKKRALDILGHLRSRGFYIEEYSGHLNCLNDELIEAMGGVVQNFVFSVEAASVKLQKYINKRLDMASIPDKVRKLYEKGITSSTTFIVGFPPETDEDLRKNIDLMLKLKEINPFVRGNINLFLALPKTQLFYEVEKDLAVKLPVSMPDLEEANFWVKSADDRIGKRFRPWLSEERFKFLVRYGWVFNDIFKANNLRLNHETARLLEDDRELREMFRGTEFIKRPKTDYRPYVLDKILSGEPVDLMNDLKGK